jgi:hypothetical protein
MNRLPAAVLFSSVLVALAACADSATKVTEPVALKPVFNSSPELNDNYKHVMKLKDEGKKDAQEAEKEARNEAKIKPGAGSGIYYHGGPVLKNATNVVAIYWASSPIYNGGPAAGTTGSGAQDGSLVGYFLRSLGGSAYFNINSTYTDGGGAPIANIVNYTGFWANNLSAPSGTGSVSDAQMVTMLQSGFNTGKLAYDASTLYAIFTSGKVNLGGGFGSQYCAYHTHGTVTIGGVAKTVLYAAQPYNNAYPGVCTEGTASPNGDAGADAEVNTLAHEIEETTTDMMGNAWYDRRGYENADKCAWNWGGTYTTANGGVANLKIGTKDFLIQQNWINVGSGGCGKSYP